MEGQHDVGPATAAWDRSMEAQKGTPLSFEYASQRLDAELEHLYERVGVLQARLGRTLRASMPQPSNPSFDSPQMADAAVNDISAPISQEQHSRALRISGITETISDMLDRLEI